MRQEWIGIMKSKKQLKLTFRQTITHYWIVLFLLFLTGLFIQQKELITASIPFFILAIVFAFIQYKRLELKEIKINYTDDQFQEAVRRTVNELEWRVKNNQKGFFLAFRPWNWSGSWGEMITIVKDKDRLLINSICDPDSRSSVVSSGWNKKNVKTFLTNLTETIQGIPARRGPEEITTKNEWTIKKIIIRFFAYPFCLFLIVMGVYMVLKPLSINTIIAGLGAITISIIYLYADLKIILTKNQK